MKPKMTISLPEREQEISVDALVEQLERERRQRIADEKPNDLQTIHEFRRLFRLQSDRTSDLFSDPRLKFPELAALFRLAANCLNLSKLIYHELELVEAEGSSPFPASTVQEMLELVTRQFNRIDNQIALLDCIDWYADNLCSTIRDLRHSRTVLPGKFQKIARRMIIDLDRSCQDRFLELHPDVSLRKYLSRNEKLTEPGVYAIGIEAARLMTWETSRSFVQQYEREELAIAAMLQDVGLLDLVESYQMSAQRLADKHPELYRDHPAHGAALVAGIHEYSIELPYLIGQHHERLDGSGYPKQINSHRIIQNSRRMGIISRYLELINQNGIIQNKIVGSQASTSKKSGDIHCAAALQLHRESEQSEFDPKLTVSFLEGLGFELQSEQELSDRQLRLDTAHLEPSGAHVITPRSESNALPTVLLRSDPAPTDQRQVDKKQADAVQADNEARTETTQEVFTPSQLRRRRGHPRYASFRRRR